MRSGSLPALLLIGGLVVPARAEDTMRVDYYHTGNARTEMFSLDRAVIEPLPWPGPKGGRVDDTNSGKYLFQVVDPASNRVLYSRGFASIYGEWETTGEALRMNRTFHESLRFPAPPKPVQVVIKKRDPENLFREVWSLLVDPNDMLVDDSTPPSPGPLIEVQKRGEPPLKVDFLLIGDGYTAGQRSKCESDSRRFSEVLFSRSPFRERRDDFNVWALCPQSVQPGISRPSTGSHKRTPLATTYDAFRSERYILSFDNRTFREVASFAPYEFVEILVNNRTYGGGGILGLYGTVAVDNQWADYVFIHEFGHHFAGLADEYYTSPVAYIAAERRVEPWEPNVTALLDPGTLKWKDLVDAPVPTPWKKADYEEHARRVLERRQKLRRERRPEEEMEALFEEQRQWETRAFSFEEHAGRVGAFEGAMYEARGFYRPQIDCIMFSRNDVPFCKVCRRALERVIDLYTGK